jgi:hypothetical protein
MTLTASALRWALAGGLAVDSNLGWKAPETWTAVPMNSEVKGLMVSYLDE